MPDGIDVTSPTGRATQVRQGLVEDEQRVTDLRLAGFVPTRNVKDSATRLFNLNRVLQRVCLGEIVSIGRIDHLGSAGTPCSRPEVHADG